MPGSNRGEVAMVERRDPTLAEALRGSDDRCVDRAERQILVAPAQLPHPREVACVELRNLDRVDLDALQETA